MCTSSPARPKDPPPPPPAPAKLVSPEDATNNGSTGAAALKTAGSARSKLRIDLASAGPQTSGLGIPV